MLVHVATSLTDQLAGEEDGAAVGWTISDMLRYCLENSATSLRKTILTEIQLCICSRTAGACNMIVVISSPEGVN